MGKVHVVVGMISEISKRKAKKIKILLLGSSNQYLEKQSKIFPRIKMIRYINKLIGSYLQSNDVQQDLIYSDHSALMMHWYNRKNKEKHNCTIPDGHRDILLKA